MRKIITSFCAIFILFCMPVAAGDQEVKTFVDKVAHEIIGIVKNKTSPASAKDPQILEVLKRNFDIKWMSKFTLGKHYKELSEDQKKQYFDLYTYYLLANYSPILMKYSDEKYNIVRVMKADKNSYDVDVDIIRNEGPKIKLRYHITEEKQNEYKAVDMLIEGVSTILNQRSEFAHIVQSRGIEGFLQELRNKKASRESV